MTDIMALAKQAGLMPYTVAKNAKELQSFADLIRQDEREVCAKTCEAEGLRWKESSTKDYQICAAAIRARTTT